MSMSANMQKYQSIGKAFYSYGVITVPVSSVIKFLFNSNNTQVSVDSVIIAGSSGDGKITIFNEPTITDAGSILPVHNYNLSQNDANEATLANGAVATSNDGDEIIAFQTFADASGNKTISSSVQMTDQGSEWKLPENNKFLIKVENLDTVNVMVLNFKITWSELD